MTTSSNSTFVEAGPAGDLDQRADGNPLGAFDRRDEVGQSLVLVFLAVACQQNHPLGEGREAGPHLVPVEDPVVAVADRRGLRAGEIAARSGLGESLAPDLVGGEQRLQVLLLLFLGAVVQNRRRGHAEADDVDQERSAGTAELLAGDSLEALVPASAVLARVVAGDQAGLVALLLPGAEVFSVRFVRDLDRQLGQPARRRARLVVLQPVAAILAEFRLLGRVLLRHSMHS